MYKKILHSDEGDFKILVKVWYILEEILQLISGSFMKVREVSHVWTVFPIIRSQIVGTHSQCLPDIPGGQVP